jgi:hypothetical protein
MHTHASECVCVRAHAKHVRLVFVYTRARACVPRQGAHVEKTRFFFLHRARFIPGGPVRDSTLRLAPQLRRDLSELVPELHHIRCSLGFRPSATGAFFYSPPSSFAHPLPALSRRDLAPGLRLVRLLMRFPPRRTHTFPFTKSAHQRRAFCEVFDQVFAQVLLGLSRVVFGGVAVPFDQPQPAAVCLLLWDKALHSTAKISSSPYSSSPSDGGQHVQGDTTRGRPARQHAAVFFCFCFSFSSCFVVAAFSRACSAA